MSIEFELVVPAFNEEKNLKLLVERAALAASASGFTVDKFQLVLVNNGSLDNSGSVLAELASGPFGPWFRVVTVALNQGYGFGLWSGLQATSAKWVGYSHADLQCDPGNAFQALEILKKCQGMTVVRGVRSGRNWKDIFVSRVFEFVALLVLGLRVNEMNAQPKVFPRELLFELQNPPKTFAFDLYMLYTAKRAGYKFKSIPVLFPPRIHGVSNWASNFFSRYRTILGMVQYMILLVKKEGRLR